MKQLFTQLFVTAAIIGCLADNVGAQTHYGTGAGTNGIGHTFYGTDAGNMNSANGNDGAFNTYIGHFAGKNATTGQCNTFLGNSSGMLNITGSFNTLIGFQAGKDNGNNSYNTLVGSNAGMGSIGNQNSYFGEQAGTWSKGSNNVFMGFGAGNSNNGGSDNVFLGAKAGYSNKNHHNVFIGVEAGYNCQTNDNVFVGWKSGNGNTVGGLNTYIGTKAGFTLNGGVGNTFIGHGAGEKAGENDTDENTFVGTYSGMNAKGQNNCYFGVSAGWESEGDNNIIFGVSSGTYSKGSNNVVMGFEAGFINKGNENNFIGKASGYSNTTGTGNMFAGTTSGFSNDSGTANAFFGNKAGYSNKSGSLNTFLGQGAGYDNTTGEKNTYLGYGSGGKANVINATAIGASAKVMASNCLVLGNNANIGIGVSAPVYQLQMSTGTAAKAGSASWTIMSDRRLKKGISDFTDGLDLLKKIKPVWFQYNGEAGIETGDKKFVGIIAQEMQKIAPYTIGTFIHQDSLGNKTEYLDYDANAVTYILINSVKEQQQVIEEKDAQIRDLAERLERIERQLSSPSFFHNTHDNGEQPALEQNAPNGFENQTSIKYYIPQSAKEAVINIYNASGVKMKSLTIANRGEGELVISAENMASGVHVYDLIVDGKSVGGKKMLVK
ncbi:tail fiber domain-containing protein [Dyadobacter sp. CY261]|uniref:tail fiber domain-containing protein n=1 Tax=Dyadobacter sp. CY261 TaxID=2907203 RepID=UPI001F38BA04|nr:tail fiber domain-containing protein [Dyadobacter sp. CY261]MCF0073151.1 tail fiber domain-containing protein [Dyadobacter sp. CY261]